MAGFNLSERYLLIINLLIGVVVIPYFLALGVSDFIKLHYAGNVLPASSEYTRATPKAGTMGQRSRAYYDVITRRDIFNLAPAPQATPPPVANENLNIRLIGTSQQSSGSPYAIIEDSGGNQLLYRLGDEIPNAGKLLDVTRNRAIILHNGHRVALELPHDEPVQGMPVTPRPGMIQRFHRGRMGRMGLVMQTQHGGVRKITPNRYVLDRSTVDSNLKNMAPLFTQIRAIPNIKNGQSNGFMLSEIEPGSIFQQIGLQDGDLLTAVNGQAVGDPAKAMDLMQTLQNQSSITLNVMRNGAPTHLYYNIR